MIFETFHSSVSHSFVVIAVAKLVTSPGAGFTEILYFTFWKNSAVGRTFYYQKYKSVTI